MLNDSRGELHREAHGIYPGSAALALVLRGVWDTNALPLVLVQL